MDFISWLLHYILPRAVLTSSHQQAARIQGYSSCTGAALPQFPFCFSETPGDSELSQWSRFKVLLGVALVYAPSTFIPNILKRTPPGSPQMTEKPLHYSAQYVSKGCVQIQGFSCQMYSLFPRLSHYNEMENKQDILISYSTRKWDFPPPSLLIDKLISSNILKRSFVKSSLLPKRKVYYKTGEICFNL